MEPNSRDPSGAEIGERDLRELARSITTLLHEVHLLATAEVTESLAGRLTAHLRADPRGAPVITHLLPPSQLVDVQVALDAWPQVRPDRAVEVVGISGEQRRFHPLSELLASGSMFGVGIGPVDYADMPDSPDSTRSCVQFGLFLLRDRERRAAALLRGADPHGPMQNAMLEVVAAEPGWARDVLAELRGLAVERSVLRRQVLALGPGEGHQYGALRFMHRPSLERGDVVLPEVTIDQIERHVIGIAAHGARLRAAGQHLKRGVLLYGPPGTGKTHTVRYLLSQLQDVTAFVLSGVALQLIGEACGLARMLQPSLVILEDVDLIAADRSFGPMGANPLLFEVLNQIDGLGDDVDVTFLLTTNRVDILERALAERPGRVDAAVEIAPPDAAGRLKLLRLYAAGLGVDALSDSDLEEAVAATDGRTATYLREVVRRAALAVAEREPEGALRVDGQTLAAAARALLEDRVALTRALLGGAEQPDAEPPFVGPPFGGMPFGSSGAFTAPLGTMVRGIGPLGIQGDPMPFGPDE